MMSQRKEQLRQELSEARAYLLSVARQIGPEQEQLSTENPAWNVHDLVAHLAGAERGMQATVQRFLASTELPQEFDLSYWNARQVAKRSDQNVAALIESLTASREDTLALLASLTEAQLDVPGRHPAGIDTTVAGVFRIIALHERAHAREITAALGLDPGEPVDWSSV
jgi:uncharacterized protein (TIGR03083 family)